jgi:hypothetical protein
MPTGTGLELVHCLDTFCCSTFSLSFSLTGLVVSIYCRLKMLFQYSFFYIYNNCGFTNSALGKGHTVISEEALKEKQANRTGQVVELHQHVAESPKG